MQGDRGGARRRKRQPAVTPTPAPRVRAARAAVAATPISDVGMQTRQPVRAARHQKPVQVSPQEYARRELTNPRPNPAEDLRVLGFQGASELAQSRARLQANMRAIHEPRLEQGPKHIKPLSQGEIADVMLTQAGLMPAVRESARNAPGARVSGGHVLDWTVGKSLSNLVTEHHTSDPTGAALEAGMIFTGPFRILGAAAKGVKAARAGESVIQAARAGHAAPGVIPGAGRAIGKAASRMRLRTLEVGGHVVQIPAAGSRTGRFLERFADLQRDRVPGLKSTAAKAGREMGYSVEHVTAGTKNLHAEALKHYARRLTAPQEYALRIVAEGATPESRLAFHNQQAALATRADQVYYHALHADITRKASKYVQLVHEGQGRVVPVLADNAPQKLKKSWELFQQAGAAREGMIQDLGLLSDEAIARRIHAPARVIHGARYKTFEAQVKDALDTSPSRAALFNAIDQTASSPMAAQHDKALWDAAIRAAAQRANVPADQLASTVDSLYFRLGGVETGVTTHDLPPEIQALYQHEPPKPPPPMPERINSFEIAKAVQADHKLPKALHDTNVFADAITGIFEWAREGALYRDWYARAAGVIKDMAEREGVQPKLAAQLVALYSQSAEVSPNFQFAVKAIREYKVTGKVESFGVGGEPQRVKAQAILDGQDWEGRKTNSFYANTIEDIDQAEYKALGFDKHPVTVDRWMTRMFMPGHTNPGGYYDAFERAIQLIADELGWHPKEVQAAAWTAMKKQKVRDRWGWSDARAMEYAGDAYERGYNKTNTLFQEATPPAFNPHDRSGFLERTAHAATRDLGPEQRKAILRAFAHYRQSGDETILEATTSAVVDLLQQQGAFVPPELRNLLDELRLPASVTRDFPTPEAHDKSVIGIRPQVIDHLYEENKGEDLLGLPETVKYAGEEIAPHSYKPAQDLAKAYMDFRGLPYRRPSIYVNVDPAVSKKIADAYEAMPHDPNNPEVKAAYQAFIDETMQQYKAITDAGYTFEFYPDHPNAVDPYPNGPRDAMVDVIKNRHMYVYPTEAGFGTETAGPLDHPLLGDSGENWNGKLTTYNDIFRGVHDFFGHAKEGVGFRADGEENAWLQHKAMYTRRAARAMTTETRGQNSWVNYGPHGETNRVANQAGTVYADQKAGLLPEWVSNDTTPGAQAETDLIARERARDPYYETINKINLKYDIAPGGFLNDVLAKITDPADRMEYQQAYDILTGGSEFTNANPAEAFKNVAAKVLGEHGALARDIVRSNMPEKEWPTWAKNQLRTQAEAHGMNTHDYVRYLREAPQGEDPLDFAAAAQRGIREIPTKYHPRGMEQRGGSLDYVSPYGVKGAITIDQHQAILHLTEASDDTTLAHELAHFTRAFLTNDVKWKPVAKYLGVKGGQWDRNAEEKFARALERVVRTGDGPAPVKKAFQGLAPIFREVYANADLPDVPPHVARFIQRLFDYKPKAGGSLVGAEDITVGVEYAPTFRGVPVRLSRPGKAFAAYMRRAGSGTARLFSGGRAGRAIGAGPQDAALAHEYQGSLLLNGFFTFDVAEPKVQSAMLATKMSLAHIARKGLVDAGHAIPESPFDFAVKIDPSKDASDKLKMAWAKINSLEAGSSDETALEGATNDLLNEAIQSIIPSEIAGRSYADVAREVIQTQEPVDNIVWVNPDFLEHSGLLTVPGASKAQTDTLRKAGQAVMFGYDALTDAQKALILWLNPAYVPMQLVGNLGMNLLHQGVFMPVNLWKSVLMHRELDPLYRVFIDSKMGTGAAGALLARTAGGKVFQATLGHWANIAADLVPRRAAFLHEARKLGLKSKDMPELIDRALKDDAEASQLVDYITRRAKRSIVDFDRLNRFEREVLTRFIFFYPWLRGATDYSVHFIADHPVQAMGMALAYEHLKASQHKQLGEQPYFTQLDVPISTETVGLKVPGTGIDVGLNQVVGKHSETFNGAPQVFSMRQLLTQTTPLELLNSAIAFAGGGSYEAAADVAQHITPIPYAAAVATLGYDPFSRQEVRPGLGSFFRQLTPAESPFWQRYTALNMSPQERADANKHVLHPRTKGMQIEQLFLGSLAPSGYNKARAEELALKHAPTLARRIATLKLDARAAGIAGPSPRVLDDLEWKTKLDHELSQLGKDASYSEKAKVTAALYDQRYKGRKLSARVARLRTEGQAQHIYEAIRPRLYPAYSRYQLRIDHITERRTAHQPVGQG